MMKGIKLDNSGEKTFLILTREGSEMTIDNTIKKMEETLAKKKVERNRRLNAKIIRLDERVTKKIEWIQKLNDEARDLNDEIATLKMITAPVNTDIVDPPIDPPNDKKKTK